MKTLPVLVLSLTLLTVFSETSPILTEKQAKQLLRSRRQDRPSKPGFPDEPMRFLMRMKSYFDIYGQKPWGGGEREYTLESNGSTRECSNPGSFTMSCANLGIWPNSRAAYHEQPCLLTICGVSKGKGLALTIQSFRKT
ncbi:uncharacterized protein C17orf67 homolog [Hylobates moloch]|uniref:uncharacterized protein C17orf67 homolog n=1 Tax=Hylobates moloch TaxID=81572 RepID=UPI0026764735|nr:uncharacterized protein C17orf67 homolog [Hylobates moloch]XP_058300937.1 uncharacterized protein C17orf67 homolog [Hylobates moloch]